MSEAPDKFRRYLVPVEHLRLPDEPDLVHLSVYQWESRWGEFVTDLALCGRSAEQGALPDGTAVTCPECLHYQPKYQTALDLQAGLTRGSVHAPAAQDALHEQVRAAVKAAGLKQVWIAERLGITPKHLSQLLTGRVPLSLDWADRILALCGKRVRVVVEAIQAPKEASR
ncbi:helix-turn-helix transcriptional regulator [Streptomyces olivaceiscleroticus]|uniref:HTH cro/C1-type domain-containing protein n=1 Tax=Streptomyces olivaceiscleroticus TaxID=68245 RepID=A0ABP3LJ41_9ACTN